MRADLERRAEPVIGVIRWHLDVGDHDVGAVDVRLPDQFARIGGGPDHLEPAVLEDMHDSLAHDGLVLADEHPDRCGLSHGTKLRDSHVRANEVPAARYSQTIEGAVPGRRDRPQSGWLRLPRWGYPQAYVWGRPRPDVI